jgi:4'-phosphopantetheinyl transferase
VAVNSLARFSLPLRPRDLPDPGHAELWLFDLARLSLDPVPQGSGRAGALRARRIRQQFMLRLLLGSYLGCPGRDIELARGERGKPVLAGRHSSSPLGFNLSHSDGWLAVAVARDRDVGVDVERERVLPRALALAERYFPAAEGRQLSGLDEPFLSRAFLELWTAREALVKAHGCGLAGVMREIELAGSPPALLRWPREWGTSPSWSLVRPSLPDGLVGHLACAGEAVEVATMVLADPPGPAA